MQVMTMMNMSDTNVEEVVEKYITRSEAGFKKYGHYTTRQDLSIEDWLTHLQEELMDATVYIQALRKQMQEQQRELAILRCQNKLYSNYIERT